MKSSGTIRHFILSMSLASAGVFLSAQPCQAQGLHNTSNIYINGAGVYVDGDIVNSGRVENDGILAFTRDWQSEGKYKGNGELQANGNSSQKIQHYNQKVAGLMINGWGTKYLIGKLSVTGTLHMMRGIVQVSPQDFLKLADSAIARGGSSDSYVDGALTVEGTGYKFFPLGKNGTYGPIEFLDVQGDDPEFSVEVFDDAPTLSVENIIIRKGLYWQRTDTREGFGASRVSVDFERSFFKDPEKITFLAGSDWKEPFVTISDPVYSNETDKISTGSPLSFPIIMLGEMSEEWAEADFYFSTALSPNASREENHRVKIFGDRLADDQFRFQVFNRWGVLVYETTSLENMKSQGWDGRARTGVELTSGIYPYKLNAIDKTGSKFEKAGVITIVH